MIRHTPVFLVAYAFFLASSWGAASESHRADNSTEEAADSASAPTIEQLSNATYSGIEDLDPVTLAGGRWTGEPFVEGGASAPALWLSSRFHLTGDLDGDGVDEAVAHLTFGSGGTGNFGYLAVMGREGDRVVQRALGLIGDRVQIRSARISEGSVVLDVLQVGPDDGMCCPTQLATRRFIVEREKLVETDTGVTGVASVSMLDDTQWELRELEGQEMQSFRGQATMAFTSGKISGSTGCNRYQGTVRDGEYATSLVVGPLITTRMACPEPLMRRERVFLSRLEKAEVFQFLVGDLVLSGAEGALVFSRRQE